MGEGQSKEGKVGGGGTGSGGIVIEKREIKDSMKQFTQGELALLDNMFRDLSARSPGMHPGDLVLLWLTLLSSLLFFAASQNRRPNCSRCLILSLLCYG